MLVVINQLLVIGKIKTNAGYCRGAAYNVVAIFLKLVEVTSLKKV
jgi:hypothetical protein